VVTDPPYGQDQEGVSGDEPEKLYALVAGAVPLLPVDNAVIVAFQSPRTFPVWLDAIKAKGHKFERMLWLYKAAQCTFPWRGWLLTSEAIVLSTFGNGQWQDVHPYEHDCYYLPEVSGQLGEGQGWHGSVKHLAVVSDLIQRVSLMGAVVFDGFVGAGTTLIGCEKLGRHCRAIDIDAGSVAVTLERWAEMTGREPVLMDVFDNGQD